MSRIESSRVECTVPYVQRTGAEHAERAAVVPVHPLVRVADEQAEDGGRAVEVREPELLDHGPVAAVVREARRALEQQRRAPVEQRAVHDVRVARDPPDVRHAAEHVLLGVDVEARLQCSEHTRTLE